MKITKSKKWYYNAYVVTWLVAWACCVVPTFTVGAVNLPLVVAKEAEQTLTGSAIILIACCAYPIFKGLLKMLKSPSAWLIMWIVALITLALYKIPHETLGAMVVVFMTAAIGNSVGAFLFWLSKKFKEKWAFCGQVTITGGDIK